MVTVRHLGVLAICALMVGVAGCDLPLQVAGAPCPVAGELAQDETDLLKCSDGLVWEPSVTVDQADLLFERLTATIPTPASPAPIEPTAECPISRRYALAGAGLPPNELKDYALATTIQAPKRGCGCVVPRRWNHGMDRAAASSLRDAMAAKEQIALAEHAAFGVPPEAVNVRARTIFFRNTWRSYDEQACLRRAYGAGAFPPGESRHELGIAVDLEDWEPIHGGRDEALLRAHGWCRTSRAEGWHFEYRPALDAMGEARRCLS